MALVSLPSGLWVESYRYPRSATGNQAIDAVGESYALIGRVRLQGRTGSKTLSSAGGKVWSAAGNSVTFSNAGSTLRLGIQDVDLTTGLEDGSYDVSGDLTGGGGGFVANAWNKVSMGSGSKTIADGDLVAVIVEMTARGGADTIAVRHGPAQTSSYWLSQFIFPYGTADTGSGPAKVLGQAPLFFLQFDDGTYGWIEGSNLVNDLDLVRVTFNSGSTPDEIAAVFEVPFRCTVDGYAISINNHASTDTCEFIFYTDPLGTPAAHHTYTPDPDVWNSGGAVDGAYVVPMTALTLSANTPYAIAVRPTSANALGILSLSMADAEEPIKYALGIFGLTARRGTRTDQTGAFSLGAVGLMPTFTLIISEIDDGAGAGGGLLVHPGMAGGMRG